MAIENISWTCAQPEEIDRGCNWRRSRFCPGGALFAWLFLIPETGSDAMIWVVALISAAGAVISQVGDLSASAIKRNHDIKDYGKIIPGHGGIMDRFDSLLFTAPVIYFLSVILLGAVH